MTSDASHMLEAALEQMDDIIGYPSQVSDSALIPALTLAITPDIRVLQLVEDLRVALEGQVDQESMRRQVPIDTAHTLLEWLEKGGVNQQSPVNGETNQERLTRLEGDKESLVLQVSVLTDQVEAQGVKISDLESSLEEHQHKLNSTEEMLQQELLSRTSLESQKLNLMGEVSYLKLKLVDMEEKQFHGVERQHKAESVVNLISELQEQMCRFQQEINCRIREKTGQADSSLQKACDTWSTDAQNPDQGLACDGSPEEVHDSGLEEPPDVIPFSGLRNVNDAQVLNIMYSMSMKSITVLSSRIRRTQSGGLQGEDLEPNQFRRGGLRATAGPRLTRTPESGSTVRDMNTPFSQWTREQVCGWLEDYGLGQYVNLTRQWVDNGQTLLSARPQDFEKEMGINHPLHRKKLQLALRGFSTKALEKSSELDHIWVTRWLDDIGLPQYKDQFHEGRVDGRMLQYLTVNDLLFLKVTSQLHHLSIKCAIHVLHVNKFNPHCLRRRPGEERNPSPSEVIQWSNHRVMEWLRAVDLAEYAPNLRGSGVHGGLIILELRFSSETLAMLLNIPPQKTLLRRHLATAFTALVGMQASLEKREYANATGHAPLTTAAKVRPKKLGFTHFSHLRKRRPDDLADYICPIDSGGLSAMNGVSHRPYAGVRGLSPILDREPERREQVGPKSAVMIIQVCTQYPTRLAYNYILKIKIICRCLLFVCFLFY
uniref:PPFIA binding protein 2 n=1 Tax=Oncorhynchus kisutch TaxID=8019 RepID=A0A8C7HM68_ONCKI